MHELWLTNILEQFYKKKGVVRILTFNVANNTMEELRILLKAKKDFTLRVSYKIEGKISKVRNITRLRRKVFK